ncbi:MAG: hypothetical protein P8011_19550 [Acidihalobacter sp.]|jgi:hypothetical protein|uniref:hypothetical protein n=1 Tax=Acidihalobacter sp. TaxID=1872108 RepID=UPI00307FC982
MDRNKRIARRHFLRRSVGAALGTAVPLLWSGGAEAGKVSKSAMAYRNSPNGGQSCSGCIYFQPGANAAAPGTCSVVAGSISPRGYCIAFSPKV